MSKSISSFVNAMSANGGMSLTTGYNISWSLPSLLTTDLGIQFPGWEQPDSIISMMVEEAQLPNVQSATGQIQGRYLGENQIQYPYAKLYSDVSFTWMCDANMTPFKFFHYWYNYIYSGNITQPEFGFDGETGERLTGRSFNDLKRKAVETNSINRQVRLKYPDRYLGKCIVIKTEPGAATVDDRASVAFVLEDIYPYSIDTVPMSYGTSQLTKVSVNFHYAKHTIITNDISNYGTGGDFKKIIDDLKKAFGIGN
jgi:hypothetical protein